MKENKSASSLNPGPHSSCNTDNNDATLSKTVDNKSQCDSPASGSPVSGLPEEFEHYKPSVSFHIDTEKFIIKTAETEQELLGVFHLRHNVFYKERKGVSFESQLSIDEHDIHADHLILIDKNSYQVKGSYRFIPSKFKGYDYFCNWKYFDIHEFLHKKKRESGFVEMEWACTHKELRSSQAIHCMWLGMARYFREVFSRYMFGQVNVLNIGVEEAACIYNTFMDQGVVDKTSLVVPTKRYTVVGLDKKLLNIKPDQKSLAKISRLFKWYLKLGARVHGQPMFDPEFNSYGFFLSIDFKNIKYPQLVNHYKNAVYLRDNLPE